MAPVFSLVLDEDVTSEDALDFPELYKDLMKVTECTCVYVVCESVHVCGHGV